MLMETVTTARIKFRELPYHVRVPVIVAVYLAIALTLVHLLGLEGGSMGGWTSIGDLPTR